MNRFKYLGTSLFGDWASDKEVKEKDGPRLGHIIRNEKYPFLQLMIFIFMRYS